MKKKYFYFSFFLIFSIYSIKCDIKVYPDHIASGDVIFEKSQITGETNERFYYSLGYFTNSASNPIIKSKKYGISFEPIPCSGYATSVTTVNDNDNTNFFVDKIIKDQESTIGNKDENTFEEIELFKHTINGRNFKCPSRLKLNHNSKLKITYKIPVLPANPPCYFQIDIGPSDDALSKTQICRNHFDDKKIYMMEITAQAKESGLLGNEITVIFQCTNNTEKVEITQTGNIEFYFFFNWGFSTSNVILSNYRAIVEDSYSTTGDVFDVNLIRSKNGLSLGTGCTTSNDCFHNHVCVGGICKPCHFSCLECSEDESSTTAKSACTKCNILTDSDSESHICEINYVDLSQFSDINVEIKPQANEFNERATLGLWLFFADLTKSRNLYNDIYHIVLENRIVISIVPGDNIATAYCHTYEDLYRKVTSDTKLFTSYSDTNSDYVESVIIPSEGQLGKMNIESLNGQWFHVSCAVSFDHRQFYLKTMINGQKDKEGKQPKSLKHESLYPEMELENDIFFRHILNEGEPLVLKLLNFGNSKAKIYARNLMLFREFIPYEMDYMYFDFTDKNDFLEILYQIPFNLLYLEPYKIIGYQYDNDGGEKKPYDIPLELSSTVDLHPPLNFKRLFLSTPNEKYTKIDLSSSISLTKGISGGNYYYNDGKLLNCLYSGSKPYLSRSHSTCVDKCVNSEGGTITFRGVSNKSGYCDYLCESDMTCEKEYLNENDYDSFNTKFCQTTSLKTYNLFFECVPESKDYYLQFSGFYNSQLMTKTISPSLKSYIIEFWFYPDFFLQSTSRTRQFTFPTETKNFFFHSNVIDCYFQGTDKSVPIFYDNYKVIKITSGYNENEWNNFVIHGKFDTETKYYQKTVYINHEFNKPYKFDQVTSGPSSDLSLIAFCEKKCQDLSGESIHWTTGYYKDLRIWDADMANIYIVVQYDDFYPDIMSRVYALRYYYPMKNKYIGNNKVKDPIWGEEFIIKTARYYFKKYNYSSKFDIIIGKDKLSDGHGYYTESATDPPFITMCDNGCKRCWTRDKCYQCLSDYFLSGTQCIHVNKYYHKSPCSTSADKIITYTDSDENIAVTICFWTKPIGFADITQDMVSLGENLKLVYSCDTSKYGLSLLMNTNVAITQDINFRDNIGQWTFISMAYHKEIKKDSILFFPKMMKFEINSVSFVIDYDKLDGNLSFKKIVISKGYFGLFKEIKYYTEYIINSLFFEKEGTIFLTPFRTAFSIKPKGSGNDALFCEGTSHLSEGSCPCVPDEEPDSGTYDGSCKLLKEMSTTDNTCMNFCTGEGWTKCTCLAKNSNSQMIMKNGNKNYCRPLDYINFAKANTIVITSGIGSGKVTKKYTMQFWMYAYNYVSGTFKGVTFIWSGHNKIDVTSKNDGNKYKFICSTLVGSGGPLDTEIIINKWNFLSCAVDFEKSIMYINTNNEDDENKKESTAITGSPDVIDLNPTLTIIDKSNDPDNSINNLDDWGVLFYRQIRLWKDAYFNAPFLSRVNIQTQAKFPNLLNNWEPTFKGNIGDNYDENIFIKDIAGNADFSISYPEDGYNSKYGMNFIDEEKYKIITLCSEDGLYYDTTLKQCLQFIDLSKMKDFTFPSLPSAYSGSYTMAFWVFFENTESYIDKGLHLKWSRHLQITIKKENNAAPLIGYCFPQGYYSDYTDDDSDFQSKYNNALNKDQVELLDSGTSDSGTWIWVVCSVSYYKREFYINGNKNEPPVPKPINPEALSASVTTSYPMRFYLSDIINRNMYKSSLSIINISANSKLYLRSILLFRNFIPFWYSSKFKYMDFTKFTDDELPALLFVANFAQFTLKTRNLKYYIYERPHGNSKYERVDTSLILEEKTTGSTFELSANFQFQALCELSDVDYKKYDEEKGCIDIKECVLKDIHAIYCMEEKTPIACSTGYILRKTADDKIECTTSCLSNEMITPGTVKDKGICNTDCPDNNLNCPTTVTGLTCENDYDRIAYKCIDQEKDEKSALFFSKCYNSPNFYRTISTATSQKIASGYFYEFWMLLDNTLINCADGASEEKEYYLYSTPHSIYKEATEFYYQIINSSYKKKISGIDETKWNKLIIKTTIESTSQNSYLYVNFEKVPIAIEKISTDTNMKLQYISFCSRRDNGDCIPGSSVIMWGSAYYRNIRIWDAKTCSIQVIQDYNNGLFAEALKSLILFYPLTIKYMDNNIIKETISGLESISVTHDISNNFQSDDNVIFYNYEYNIDWYFKYECVHPELLVNEECKEKTGYFLKVPAPDTVSFNIDGYGEKLKEQFTFCIYLKFIGVLTSSISAMPIIFSFKDDTFIAFDLSSTNLIFFIGGSENEGFRDTNFQSYIGIWTPICIANYKSADSYVYPHMLTFNVNKIDIKFSTGFTIPNAGIKIERISLGNEIIAYFADLRIYSNFLQGNFGNIIFETSSKNLVDILKINYKLFSDEENGCILSSELKDFVPNIPCVKDYNIYHDLDKRCENGDYFFDTGLNKKTCDLCDTSCKSLCFYSGVQECTCDTLDTLYWLRKHKSTSKTYCEHPPYIDYSLLEPVEIEVPSSYTNESTIEFWFYIYSYNTTIINFKELNVIWEKHNRIRIYNEKNSLSAKCYALWGEKTDDNSKYEDLSITISVTAFKWTAVRCGSDISLPQNKYFFNTYEKNMVVENPPYDRYDKKSKLRIENNGNPASYGFFFIRELKLWQQYNSVYIDTSYIALSSYGLYDSSQHKSEGSYPGLITFIQSKFEIEDYQDALNGEYHLINLVIKEDDPTYSRKTDVHKGNNFIGYNLVDPGNAGYYSSLSLCEEGQIYNSLYDRCEKPSFTKCKFAGDTKDTCIQCQEESKYIHPVDGYCKTECPTGFYKRDEMNQCRPCHEYCYKCVFTYYFNCTECTGERYFVKSEGKCVLQCEDYNLTAHQTLPNLCTEFEAEAILINYKDYFLCEDKGDCLPVDINSFDYLVAKVTNYTSRGYTVEWGFEPKLTREANNNNSMQFPFDSPFIGDLTHEEKVLINKTFFELAKEYVVSLKIIAHNIVNPNVTVSVPIYFKLRMNSFPVNGTLFIFPSTGLYMTTYFIMRCENWEDDTTKVALLQYRFFKQEEDRGIIEEIRGWSSENEMSSNFSVFYDQKPKSTLKIICEIKDNLNASITMENKIVIARQLTGGIYNLSDSLVNYSLPTETSSDIYNVLLYHRSQFLLSLSIDAYKTLYPSFIQTKYESTIDGLLIIKEDPSCVSSYCNGNGKCTLVDEFIICDCNNDYIGLYCHMDIYGVEKLEQYYRELFQKVLNDLNDKISYYQFMIIHNLFQGASLFFDDISFFKENLQTFLQYAMNNFHESIQNNTIEYLELIDYYYSYEIMRMEQLKAKIKKEENSEERNITFKEFQMGEFKEAFEDINNKLLTFLSYLAKRNAAESKRNIIFNSVNYYAVAVAVSPSFDDKKFFENRKTIYKTYIDFMDCLNYIEMEKFSNPYYNGYLIYIEYNYFPYSYNDTLIVNNSSPMVEMRFIDTTSNKYLSVAGCEDNKTMVFHMPFTSYRYLDDFNSQKYLYDPFQYKGPGDPIFADPIYINESGFVTTDTVDQRIERYNRRYNISPRYFDDLAGDFVTNGLTYQNFTGDTNYIIFHVSHLSKITNFMIPNNATFNPNGRFFYLGRPRVLKWLPNYYTSIGSIILLCSLIIYFILVFMFFCYERQYTGQEQMLNFIKMEIVKNFYPYAKNKDILVQKLIPTKMNCDFVPEIIFGPKTNQNIHEKSIKNKVSEMLEKDQLITLNQNTKKSTDRINEDVDIYEEEKTSKASSSIRKNKRNKNRKKAKKNNYFSKQSKKEEEKKNFEEEEKKSDDVKIEQEGDINKATFRINYLPKDFENEEEENRKRIENYNNLRLSTSSFFCKNFKLRNLFLNSLCNVSLFQPRWKKLTMLVTEIGIMELVISILLTVDEAAKFKNKLTLGFLVGYALAAMAVSNAIMYGIAHFFEFPPKLARRLYKLVVLNGQLIVVKEWGEMVYEQGCKAVKGYILCIILWAGSFYISFGFTSVWYDQKFEFLVCFLFAFVLNFFFMELIVEAFIALFFHVRKKHTCLKNFGEALNRLRNYRCLSP